MARSDRRPRTRLDPDSRRAALLDAAAQAFAARPYDQVTLASIAQAADASTPLLYRYFPSKEELYAAVVRLALEDLAQRQRAALQALPDGVPARDRLRATTLVYLDHIADHPDAWAMPLRQPGLEPAAAVALRIDARTADVAHLSDLLAPSAHARHDYALWGYFGFLDAACLRWVEKGCPEDERWSLLDSALGALEGALGDWAA